MSIFPAVVGISGRVKDLIMILKSMRMEVSFRYRARSFEAEEREHEQTDFLDVPALLFSIH